MGVSSFLVPILGLLMGIALTFQISRIIRSNASTIKDHAGWPNTIIGAPNSSNSSPSQLTILYNKRIRLADELKKVESEILKLSPTAKETTNSSTISTTITKPISSCPYAFKVYVYNLPPSLQAVRFGQEARVNQTLHVCHKCILEQFSLEYIVQDFFTNFCGRTNNPDKADFFYLPLIRDAEFRFTKDRMPSSAESALLAMMEKNDSSLWKSVFGVTDKYWHAHHGANHIIAMPAPVTNLRHEGSRRGYFHYMLHLHTPIFLCLEYSANFVTEYPICSTQKNIVVPYPTTDPELYSGKLTSAKIERNYLLYYAGGLHGECVEVRKAMKVLMQNSTRLHGVVPPVKSNMADREHGFLAATFCPIPIGDSPSSKRMYDVLNFGCIPVVLSDDLIWAYSDQTGGPLNHRNFSLQMPQSVVHFTARKSLTRFANNRKDMGMLHSGVLLYDLLEGAVKEGKEYQNGIYVNPLVLILQRIPAGDVAYLRGGVRAAAPYYRFYKLQPGMTAIPTAEHVTPEGGAIEMLALQLQQRKDRGIDVIRDTCRAEKSKKHKYIGNYACDGRDKVDSLVRRRRLLSERSMYQTVSW